MNKKVLKEYYSDHFKFHEELSQKDPKYEEKIAAALEKERGFLKRVIEQAGGEFLDIGCDDGLKTQVVAELSKAKPFGVDIIERRIESAKKRGVEAQVIDADWEKLPFDDGKFDMIFCNDVIEHVFSPDHLLMEIRRLLKDGGYAIVETANLASWKNRLMLFLGWQPYFTEVSTKHRVGNPRVPNNPPAGHIRVFTLRALKELSSIYGFHVEQVVGEPTGGRSFTGRVASVIDSMLLPIFPGLADLVIVKLRKT